VRPVMNRAQRRPTLAIKCGILVSSVTKDEHELAPTLSYLSTLSTKDLLWSSWISATVQSMSLSRSHSPAIGFPWCSAF
jgi:hypothetical protein